MAPKRKAPEPTQPLLAKVGAVKRVFNTTDGKILLEALEQEFDARELVAASPEMTYFNLGRRDVLVYLRQLRDAKVATDPLL